MKHLPIIMLAIASMASCSSEEILNEPVDNGQSVPVVLNAKVGEIQVKSAINQGTEFKAQVIARKKSATDYSAPLWGTDAKGNITVATDGKVEFPTPQYYPADGSEITMRGFSPQSTDITNGIVSYTINGTQDIMITPEVEGSKENSTGKNLQFAHLLTQLEIKVLAENQDAIDIWGNITSIKVQQATTTLELNLKDGTLAPTSPTPTKADLALEGFTNPMTITTAEASAGTILLLPSPDVYKLLITTTKKTSETLITPDLTTTVKGTKYVITLTFKAKDITTTAAADSWTNDPTGGTGTVE